MLDIVDYIPRGRESAISRKDLCSVTGLPDRMVRRAMQHARLDHVIISSDSGDGYYRPTISDYPEVKGYLAREQARSISILKGLTVVAREADKMKEEIENGDR